jgi:hypothetical protein
MMEHKAKGRLNLPGQEINIDELFKLYEEDIKTVLQAIRKQLV